MGGYRSLKRVLGESNLERKCRWLFGICVGGLILLAFWWVDRISEGLIEDTAQSQGRDLASYSPLRISTGSIGRCQDEGHDRQRAASNE